MSNSHSTPETDVQQVNRAVERILATFGRCTDGAETPMPAPVQQLMSALSHLSDFQEVSEDEEANERINMAKLPIIRELEAQATRTEMLS